MADTNAQRSSFVHCGQRTAPRWTQLDKGLSCSKSSKEAEEERQPGEAEERQLEKAAEEAVRRGADAARAALEAARGAR